MYKFYTYKPHRPKWPVLYIGRMMSLYTVILIIAFLQLSAKAFAQKIALSEKNATLPRLFTKISKQAKVDFILPAYKLKDTRKVNINVRDYSLDAVLKIIFKDQPLDYYIEDKFVVVFKKSSISRESGSPSKKYIHMHGKVIDENKKALPGASIKIKGEDIGTITNQSGNFTLENVREDAIIIIGYIGYLKKEVTAQTELGIIQLNPSSNELQQINVTVNTGYQTLYKERATGSFTHIDNELLNRSVGTNVLQRLDGVTSGLIFNKFFSWQQGSFGRDPVISIRGRSTIFANTEPLIVLDNFPYDGDLNNINPNDIESVTILKDAAAASIWGVRAGNGVIVLTSKKGKLNQIPKVSFNANMNIAAKPNLYSVPQMTSREYIELEKYWFDKGKYDFALQYSPTDIQSPVIDLLEQIRKNPEQAAILNQQLEGLKNVDSRADYTNYFLRSSVNQQYSLNINGGSNNSQYYISGGLDKNLANLVSDLYTRYNLTANSTYAFFNNRLKIGTDLLFTKTESKSNPNNYITKYPYEELVDQNGNALPVIRDYRQEAKNALSDIGLLDWNYYPYNERLNQDQISNITDYRLGLQANYKLTSTFNIDLKYQFQQGMEKQTITQDQTTYLTRLRINQYSQTAPTGEILYPIPLGSILDLRDNNYNSISGRIQLNYHKLWGTKHELAALAGTEIKDFKSSSSSNTLYGYNNDSATSSPVDYFTYFQKRIGYTDQIGYSDQQNNTTDRFLSYYFNGSYTFDSKYTLTASLRKDESNLFGVEANQKGIPLYSFGLSWDISKEQIDLFSFFPQLKLRLTDGYNGNLSKNITAKTTAGLSLLNPWNAPMLSIINPPNPALSWEKVHVINLGLDFGIKDNVLNGSIDLYSKHGTNLIGNSPVAPQTGVLQFTGNSADILTRGLDFTLNSINLRGSLKWKTSFLLSHVKDKVTSYKMQTGVINDYVNQNYLNPMVGKPYSSLFAYPWAGLDKLGYPQGYLEGEITKDYSGILNSTDLSNLVYKGTTTPTFFGSLRNSFTFRNLDLSFNIVYKMGYSFRRGSFTASNLDFHQADYSKRWQIPGDETRTNVPALNYPDNPQQDIFYSGSEILVEKGDHIRLQDVQLSYSIPKSTSKIPFNNIKFYLYASNLGILWRANSLGLDPDYVSNGTYQIPNPRTLALGIKADF